MKTKNFLSIITIQILLLIILVFMYYAMNKHNEVANTNTFILIQILIVLTLYPLIRAYLTKFYDLFEPIYFIGFLYFLYFGVRAIVLIYNPRTLLGIEALRTTDLNAALLYSIIGFGSLLIGYYSPISSAISFKLPKLKRIFSSKNNKYILNSGIILIFLYMIGTVSRILNINIFEFQGSAFKAAESPFSERLSYANLIVTLSSLPRYVFALYSIRSFILKKNYTIVILMAIFEIGYGFLGGWKGSVVPIILILLISYNYICKKIRFKHAINIMILFIALIIFIFPLITTFRINVNISARESVYSIRNIISVASKINIQNISINNKFISVLNRFAGIDPLIILVKQVDIYQMGETLFPLFVFFIPRLIWHDKPILSTGNIFAIKYLHWSPMHRSEAAIMQIGDLYWNFGIIGIIIGMFLFGILYRILYLYLIKNHKDSIFALFFYIFFLLNFINIEGNTALVVAKSINTFLSALLVLIIIILLSSLGTKERKLNYE